MYRIYHPAFYTKRSLGASCGEYYWANERCELPPWLKKPCESRAGWGKGRGLRGAAPPSISSEMGGKKGRRGRRGSGGGAGVGGMVFV